MTRIRNRPLGPNDSWKTGQRVPLSGNWVDQYGQVNRFEAYSTFPPVVARKGGECAYRRFVRSVEQTA